MKKFDDKTLVAYADFELSEEERKEVELMLADDPEARAKVENFRKTGAAISQLAAIMDEPDPDSLFEAIRQYDEPVEVVGSDRLRSHQTWLTSTVSSVTEIFRRLLEAISNTGTVVQEEPAFVFRGGADHSQETSQTLSASDNLKLKIETLLTEHLRETEISTETASIKIGDNGTLRVVTEFLSDTQFKGEKSTKCLEIEYSEQGMDIPILFVACSKGDGSWKVVSG